MRSCHSVPEDASRVKPLCVESSREEAALVAQLHTHIREIADTHDWTHDCGRRGHLAC